jgi:meso-butanediol dehydrogenase / (S,S)-butanediol dehydrogenase / diacetyl reductase
VSGRLAGKVALITGTAGGQGRAAAELFAAEGAKIVGCDLKVEDDAETVRRVQKAGGQMVTRPVDLGDETAVKAWIDFAVATYGDFDILYNNASAVRYGKVETFSTEDWRWLIRNELDLVFFATKYAFPVLKRRGGGSIVNTASVAGVTGSSFGGNIFQFAHSMTKGGVIAMSRTWAAEFADARIRVNSISPGLIETPAFAVFPDKAALQKMIGDFMDLQLVRILGQPIDIAYCALYLASEEARFVTGQNFCIDGGLTAI